MSNKPIVHAPIATGSTEPRDIRDRFADMPNVKDFGAVGDGTTDDTAAFTAAQNSGATAIMVPKGTYNITQDVSGTFYSFGYVDVVGGGNVEIIDVLALDSVPIGTVLWLSTSTTPAGYLLCNGSAVGRATYPELFTAIGTTYGSGDGSTTFNLPNLIDKFAEGSAVAGTVKAAGLPNITGDVGDAWGQHAGAHGAFSLGTKSNRYVLGNTDNTSAADTFYFNASSSNSIYGNSNTVQPPALTLLPCIKAFSSVVGDATVIAGQLVNDIQSKVALDGSNLSGATFKAVVETWHSGTEWYRVWSDGWIEQGGYLPAGFNDTVTLSKPFSDTNYVLTCGLLTSQKDTLWAIDLGSGYDKTTTSFKTSTAKATYNCQGKNWYACGF